MKIKDQSTPLSVRVPERNIERLQKLSATSGLAISDLIRIALSIQLQVWERSGRVTVGQN